MNGSFCLVLCLLAAVFCCACRALLRYAGLCMAVPGMPSLPCFAMPCPDLLRFAVPCRACHALLSIALPSVAVPR
jgi:hypothetical protein